MRDGSAERQESHPITGLFNDAMTTAEGDAPVRAQIEAERQKRANTLLLGAITAGDAAMFEQAAREKADVNFDGGKPLQIAAQEKSPLFMRLLVTRGADVAHAVSHLEKEQAGIWRKQKERDDYYSTVYWAYKSKDDERRYKQISAAVKTLNEYEKTYIEKVAPMEAVRLQQQVLDELRGLRQEITEALHGRPVNKPKLAAPSAPQRKR